MKTMAELKEFSGDLYEVFCGYAGKFMPDTPLTTLFGGNIFIIEEEIETDEIKGFKGISLLDGPDTYDIFSKLKTIPVYWQVVLVSNDAGGPCYLVPDDIIEDLEHVRESLKKTNTATLLMNGYKEELPTIGGNIDE